MIKLFLEFLSLLQCFSIVCVWRYGSSCPYVSTIWSHLLSILQEFLFWLRTTPFLVSPTLSWIPLPLPPLIHLSYSVLMASQRGNHLLPHHFSARTPTFRGVKSASLCHHSQNMVILELDPWFVRSHVEIDYQFHLSTQEDLSLIAS